MQSISFVTRTPGYAMPRSNGSASSRTTADLHGAHHAEIAALRQAMDELRAQHETTVATRLAEQKTTLDQLHQADIATMTATNELLTS